MTARVAGAAVEGIFPNRALITVSVMLASVMQSLDNTIANVALPRMQGSFSATIEQMSWVLTSYIVSSAVMMPLSGWLAGQFGRKQVFLMSVAGFTVASVFCGMAQSLPELVAARALQGLCGAALVPMSQAVLLDINPPARHGRAMALWGMGVTMGPIMGPMLGGWLTEEYNWRWVFYINVPLGALAALGVLTVMPDSPRRRSSFDFVGFAALSVGVAALQITLDRGSLKDWFSSGEVWLEAVAAGLGFYLFMVHTLTTRRQPFVSLSLFKDRNFATGSIFIFVVGLVLFATYALLPTLMQDLLNYPVLTAGLVTAPRGLGGLLAMLILGRVIGRLDARWIIGAGFAVTAYAFWQMTQFSLQMDVRPLVWSGVYQGLGVSLAYMPLSAVAFATLAPELRNEGTAIFSLIRSMGSSLGISMVQALLTSNTQVVHAELARHLTPYGQSPTAHAMAQALATHGGIAGLNRMVTGQATMIAYLDDFKLMMLFTLAAMPLLLLMRGARPSMQPQAALAE